MLSISKAITAGVLFILIFVSGYVLSNHGKPYGNLTFTIHKLLMLGTVILLVNIINNFRKITPLDSVQIVLIAISAACFLLTVVSGALLSILKELPAGIHGIHQVAPYLTVITSGVWLVLLAGASQNAALAGSTG